MSDAVRIRYEKDTEYPNGHVYFAGAEFDVISPQAAREFHPKAKILRYIDHRKFVASEAFPKAADDDKDEAPKRKASKKAENVEVIEVVQSDDKGEQGEA
jgi:hypothetical protein